MQIRSFANLVHLTVADLARGDGFELFQHGDFHFIRCDCHCRAFIISAFVEKFLEKWRNNLSLQAIAVDFPRASTGKESDASLTRSEGEMHWETVTPNQTAMVSDVG